jgi:hypothetical protein
MLFIAQMSLPVSRGTQEVHGCDGMGNLPSGAPLDMSTWGVCLGGGREATARKGRRCRSPHVDVLGGQQYRLALSKERRGLFREPSIGGALRVRLMTAVQEGREGHLGSGPKNVAVFVLERSGKHAAAAPMLRS